MKVTIIVSLVSWFFVAIELSPIPIFATVLLMPGTGKLHCIIYWGARHNSQDADDNDSTNTSQSNDSSGDIGQSYHDMFSSGLIFTTYTFIVSYILPSCCVLYFYSRVIHRLWRAGSANRCTNRLAPKVTMLCVAIVFAYLFCWMPFWVVQWSIVLGAVWVQKGKHLIVVSYAAYLAQYLNSALNPFLYVFLTDLFKQVAIRKLKAYNSDGNTLMQESLRLERIERTRTTDRGLLLDIG